MKQVLASTFGDVEATLRGPDDETLAKRSRPTMVARPSEAELR
jgi:hypothetical protein